MHATRGLNLLFLIILSPLVGAAGLKFVHGGHGDCAFDLHRHLANRQTSWFPVGSCPFSLQFASSVTFSNRGPTILRDCVDLLTSILLALGAKMTRAK